MSRFQGAFYGPLTDDEIELERSLMNPEQLAKSGSEHAEQCALFCWANKAMQFGFAAADEMDAYDVYTPHHERLYVPELRWLHAIPNAGARSNKIAAAQLKAEGVKAGVADIFLPVVKRGRNDQLNNPVRFCGLYIELKRLDGHMSDVSNDQTNFGKFVEQQGYKWYVAFGWRQAASIIKEYLS